MVDSVAITPTEYAQGYKIISHLVAGASYKVEAFIDNVYNGKKRVTTKVSQLFDNPVDLRDLDDETADSLLTDNYINSLPAVDGVTTIVLKGGLNYFLTLDSLSRSLKFVTGYSFAGKAMLRMSNACDLLGNVSSLMFENVNVFGVASTATAGTHYLDFSGKYIKSVSFKNCLMGPGNGSPMGIKFLSIGERLMDNNYTTTDAT